MKRLLYLVEIFLVSVVVCLLYTILHHKPGKLTVKGMAAEQMRMPYEMLLNNGPAHDCTDPQCIEYLSEEEGIQFNTCYNMTISKRVVQKFGPIHPGKCHFQAHFMRYPVGLGSFQGSGNTWLRGLLEKITGICTGSRYCDGALRTNGFNGEGIYGPSVSAIKFHSVNPLFTNMEKLPKRISNTTPVFGAAIVLIRNPRDAMVAEWHRERTKRQTNVNVSNHFLYVGKEYFGQNQDWKEYVIRMTDRWKRHIGGWMINGCNNPIHVVKYENLKRNTSFEMFKVVEFYGGKKMSLEYIDAKISKGYNKFYRNHTDSFEHYSSDQENYISEAVTDTINILKGYYNANSLIIQILDSYI